VSVGCACECVGGRQLIKYHKRDPETLSKHLLQDVSNVKFGKEERIMNGRKEQWNKEQKPRMSKTRIVNR
jgi:hypothetical protein